MPEPQQTEERKITRGARRRLETRARLVAAARQAFARKGAGAATIAEITEEADVGLGTFYHHFDSKEAILAAVGSEVAEAEGAALDAATAAMDDPAEVMATCVRHVVRKVSTDPVWGWFVVRVGISLPELPASLLQRQARDLQRGIDAGRFAVADATTAQAAICGAMLGVVQARLTGTLPGEADCELATLVLQLLGLPPAEARELANRPLPAIATRGAHDGKEVR